MHYNDDKWAKRRLQIPVDQLFVENNSGRHKYIVNRISGPVGPVVPRSNASDGETISMF